MDSKRSNNDDNSMKKVAPCHDQQVPAHPSAEKELNDIEEGNPDNTNAGPLTRLQNRRRMLLCGGIFLLLVITGIVVGTVLGLRSSNNQQDSSNVSSSINSETDVATPAATPDPPSLDDTTEDDTAELSSGVCSVEINVQCIPPVGFEDCDSLVSPRTKCLERPSALTYRYSGKDCSNSNNMLPTALFPCVDFEPSLLGDEDSQAYVVVTDDSAIVYHADFLLPGDEFTIERPTQDEALPDLFTMTVYSSDDMATVLQTFQVDVACPTDDEYPLFLNSRFGSMQLIAYTNDAQGVVNSLVAATLVYTALGETAILDKLTSITNAIDQFDEGFLDLSNDVNGMTLLEESNDDEIAVVELTVDLSSSDPYTIYTIVQASSRDGYSCRDTHSLQFAPFAADKNRSTRGLESSKPSLSILESLANYMHLE
eukprot:CAMPEP_0119004010 /NCGR_PEP_ID=MMETSP1176-20130426/891_1 /TAXON_ID=265551 /ORGANISM="Synedropsis recta cf, Strain CCMP1620" /LENGTH=425 /DNA_ID=CAMNT_0006955667 /DNA_START=113 /DNA_END=1390 /DNA_ORIENTATION=+